jgi:hypothetical protein
VVAVDPLAGADFVDGTPLDGLVTGAPAALTTPPDAALVEPAVDGALEPPEGVKVPVRFQKAEKLLKGPPTT